MLGPLLTALVQVYSEAGATPITANTTPSETSNTTATTASSPCSSGGDGKEGTNERWKERLDIELQWADEHKTTARIRSRTNQMALSPWSRTPPIPLNK